MAKIYNILKFKADLRGNLLITQPSLEKKITNIRNVCTYIYLQILRQKNLQVLENLYSEIR